MHCWFMVTLANHITGRYPGPDTNTYPLGVHLNAALHIVPESAGKWIDRPNNKRQRVGTIVLGRGDVPDSVAPS